MPLSLAHSHAHLLGIVYGYPVIQRQSSCDRDCMSCKAEHIYYLALYRKGL